METQPNAYMMLPGITAEEIVLLQQATNDLTDDQKRAFFHIYAGKRKVAQDILIFTLIGFVCVAGVQRFVLGQIGMGLLYFFTGGFCLIGTIVDLVNHKTLTMEYNKKMAYESFQLVKMGAGPF